MTKLEEEILSTINSTSTIPVKDVRGMVHYVAAIPEQQAKILAEVAKKYIMLALHTDLTIPEHSVINKTIGDIIRENEQTWLKENGIV